MCAREWNPIQAAQGCPIVHFSFILMQTLPLCMCSFLEAKASFLNTTSLETTKESFTSNTSLLHSPSIRDKKGEDRLKNPNRINQILCLGKGCKLLTLHTSCFFCFREMWKGYQENQIICIFGGGNNGTGLDSRHLLKNSSLKITHWWDDSSRVLFHSWVSYLTRLRR